VEHYVPFPPAWVPWARGNPQFTRAQPLGPPPQHFAGNIFGLMARKVHRPPQTWLGLGWAGSFLRRTTFPFGARASGRGPCPVNPHWVGRLAWGGWNYLGPRVPVGPVPILGDGFAALPPGEQGFLRIASFQWIEKPTAPPGNLRAPFGGREDGGDPGGHGVSMFPRD